MKYKRWSESELAYMREHYPHELTSDVAKALGRTRQATAQRAVTMGLVKSDEFNNSSKSGRITANTAAWNKGKRRYRSECGNHYTRTPPRHAPIGTIIFHKSSRQYLIKVSDHPKYSNRWRPLQAHVWAERGNDIPTGHVVVLREGVKIDTPCDLRPEHLECITRAELLDRNRIQRYPTELHGLMIQLGHMRKELNENHK